jgi:DNA-binding protein H-NS
MALKTMSIDKLMKLKDQVEAALSSKVTEQRRALESELSKLGRLQGGAGRGKSALGRGGARGAVAPKYRNPENPAETWAGRGLKPRWLVARRLKILRSPVRQARRRQTGAKRPAKLVSDVRLRAESVHSVARGVFHQDGRAARRHLRPARCRLAFAVIRIIRCRASRCWDPTPGSPFS